MSIKDRGFASMDPERRRAIARLGGKRNHEMGTAHRWTKEEARAAGKKGIEVRRENQKKLINILDKL